MMVKKQYIPYRICKILTMVVRRVEKDHTTILNLKGAQVFWPDAQ